jgi:enoyl-CoA hydratase/carnithine racemase
MNDQRVSLEIKDSIAWVHLDRPNKRNALDLRMFRAIDRVSKRLRKDREIRAVIVQGRGEDFCSGLDVKSIMQDRSSMLSLLFKWLPGQANLAQRVSVNWRSIPVPVIMVIQGRCWGGGLQIALGADFRFVHTDASLSVMEGKWGLIPDMGGNLVLREILSKDTALRLAMTAEEIDAKNALDLGLVTHVSEAPLEHALKLVANISDRSPDAVAAVKKLYHRTWYKPDWLMLARESWYQVRIILGKNQRVAVRRQVDDGKKPGYHPRQKW